MALPTTKTGVCNLSLSRIGALAITDAQLTANTDPRAQHCNRHYEQTRDALQRSHKWRFTSGRIELASVWAADTVYTTDQYTLNDSVWYKCAVAHTSSSATEPPHVNWTTLSASDYTPDFEWTYQFDLPADYLRFKSIDEETGVTSKRNRHAIEGQKFLTDFSTVSLLYIKRVEDVTKFDPLYTEIFVLQLGLKLLPSLAGVGAAALRLSDDIKKELRPLMAKAQAVDSDETDVGGRSDWNLARHGGIGVTGTDERFW